jgi:hypothetical protein
LLGLCFCSLLLVPPTRSQPLLFLLLLRATRGNPQCDGDQSRYWNSDWVAVAVLLEMPTPVNAGYWGCW